MKVLCLSTLLTLFLRGKSFSSSRSILKWKTTAKPDTVLYRTAKHYSKCSSLHMHMGHSHTHNHHDDDDDCEKHRTGPELPFSLWGQLLRPKEMLLHRPQGKVLLAALLVFIPALIRKKFSKLDFGIFAITAVALSVFDSARYVVKKYISKIKMFQESMVKHSTPLTRKYFFKNENAADRITLAGVYINIILSFAKFFGGIAFHSAVLVADAGHSLSDLFSDFLTLWAVQIARLPADDDHPYGHGKFESVGSLFLSLTLLATGLSVGAWSYDKMLDVLKAQQCATGGLKAMVEIPSWPALALAAISIISKEWLFQITKKVGDALNSQILVANAWHHRSDAFSSVLSLTSIAAAMSIPGLLIADSAAGLLVAGMICLTGFEILFESVKQLTDTSDKSLSIKIQNISADVAGVLGVTQIRARTIGSGSLVDLTVLIDEKLSATAAHAIGERARWQVMERLPQVSDVLVRTRFTETLCPVLSKQQRDPIAVEKEIRHILDKHEEVAAVKRVTVHFKQVSLLTAEVVIRVDDSLSVKASKELATKLQHIITNESDVKQAEIHLDLGGEEYVVGNNQIMDMPPFNARGDNEISYAGI